MASLDFPLFRVERQRMFRRDRGSDGNGVAEQERCRIGLDLLSENDSLLQ
jgi:hypothetical protein